ncbi:MAG TPA: GNAT family N-acetyltransferase [Ruminiclostridium sp.]|nr:GNAT family N-acetyltransferase [Ruminiclostridium sp.]
MKNVRLAAADDASAMSFVHSQAWKAAYRDFISQEYLDNISDDGWTPMFKRALTQKLREAAVFELDGRITGCITFGRGRADQSCTMAGSAAETVNCSCNNSGEIISLYVLPEYWSMKQGYELTKFAVERLKSQGFADCYLWVIKGNERAEKFYRKFGFRSTNQLTAVNLGGRDVVEEKYNYIYI